MDQDTTVTEPTLTETKAEEAEGNDGDRPGKVIETFLVRVTLRLNPGDGEDDVETAKAAVPTNERVAELLERVLYEDLAYFDADAINVSKVEKV